MFTRADVEHPGAQAVPFRDTETCVVRVHRQVSEHTAGRREAVPAELLHSDVLNVRGVQRPGGGHGFFGLNTTVLWCGYVYANGDLEA